jgi:hypothetical protein
MIYTFISDAFRGAFYHHRCYPTTSRGAPCAPKSKCREPPRAGGRSCARVRCIAISATTEQKTKEKKRTDSQLKCRRTTTLAPIALSLLHAHLLAHPFVFSHIQKLPLNSFVASSSVSCLLLSVRFFNRAYLRILLRYSRLMSTVFKDCRQ